MKAGSPEQVKRKSAAKTEESKSSLRKVVDSFNIFSSSAKKVAKSDSKKTATPVKPETKKIAKVTK